MLKDGCDSDSSRFRDRRLEGVAGVFFAQIILIFPRRKRCGDLGLIVGAVYVSRHQ